MKNLFLCGLMVGMIWLTGALQAAPKPVFTNYSLPLRFYQSLERLDLKLFAQKNDTLRVYLQAETELTVVEIDLKTRATTIAEMDHEGKIKRSEGRNPAVTEKLRDRVQALNVPRSLQLPENPTEVTDHSSILIARRTSSGTWFLWREGRDYPHWEAPVQEILALSFSLQN